MRFVENFIHALSLFFAMFMILYNNLSDVAGGVRMLSPRQAARVLALHLAVRPLNTDELCWLSGEDVPPDDTERAALESLRLAECAAGVPRLWRAGPATGEFVRSFRRGELLPPGHRAYALVRLREKAGPRQCAEILRSDQVRRCADVHLTPLLEVMVAVLMRWCARHADDPAALDGEFLHVLFALQGFSLTSPALLRRILRLTARAFRMARKSGNERFTALLFLSRLYLYVFVGDNSSRLADRMESFLNTAKDSLDLESGGFLPLLEGQLAYMRGDPKKIIACFNRCSEDMVWCCRRLYDTLGVCALFSAGYLHQFHFALGSVEYFHRKAVLAGDDLTAAMFRSNSCFLLLRKGDRQGMHAAVRSLEQSPLYTEHAIVHSHVTRAHALLLFMEGDARGAHALLDRQTRLLLARGHKPVKFKDPLVLDMLHVFSSEGYPDIPCYEPEPLMQGLLQGANRHLQGTALRVLARQMLEGGAPPQEAVPLLRKSLKVLRGLGDPHALTLTLHTLAEALWSNGCREEAQTMRTMVRDAAGQDLHGSSYYDACRICMNARPAVFDLFEDVFSRGRTVGKDVGERCHAIFSGLRMPDSHEEALHLFVRSAMDAFRQERGGLFCSRGKGVRFAHTINISDPDLESAAMRPCLDWLAAFAGDNGRRAASRHERHGFVLCLGETEEDGWYLWMDSPYAGLSSVDFSEEDLWAGARLLAAELRSVLRLQKCREREVASQHDRLRKIFLGEGRNDCLVLREGLHDLLVQASSAAVTDVPILLYGETGVGKEVVARHIHMTSGRQGPFIPVHPASMVENLFESEFFGHERGAFTGALRQKTGLLEIADQGTLFIDEIGEMSPLVQTKLLRVLQEQRFMRVGGTSEIRSRFRLISATNRDLWQEAREQRFRQDLLYRIAVVPLHLPPLRQRPQDILPLANAFVSHFAQRYGKHIEPLGSAHAEQLLAYDWPGNVRELRSLIERAVILHRGGGLRLLFGFSDDATEKNFLSSPGEGFPETLPTLEEVEVLHLRKAMRLSGGRVRGPGGAAELLRMKVPTLYAKLRRHGIACGLDGASSAK